MNNHRTDVRGSVALVVGARDPAMRAGIRMAVESDGIRVCAEADSAQELITAVERHAPDVCLLDVDLRGDGVRVAAELSARCPSVAVVLLAESESETQFLQAMRVGARGYMNKAIAPSALAKVIRAAVKGELAIPRSLIRVLVDEYRDRPSRHYVAIGGKDVDLTSREWEVLEFLREGLSTRQISLRLFISEVTVRRHIGAIVRKLKVDSRADAVKLLQSA